MIGIALCGLAVLGMCAWMAHGSEEHWGRGTVTKVGILGGVIAFGVLFTWAFTYGT